MGSNSDNLAWAGNMGHLLDDELAFEPLDLVETLCRACRGRGYDRHDPDDPCSVCHGEGVEL